MNNYLHSNLKISRIVEISMGEKERRKMAIIDNTKVELSPFSETIAELPDGITRVLT